MHNIIGKRNKFRDVKSNSVLEEKHGLISEFMNWCSIDYSFPKIIITHEKIDKNIFSIKFLNIKFIEWALHQNVYKLFVRNELHEYFML